MLPKTLPTLDNGIRKGLVTVKELCDRTGITANKVNDYISRRFLLIARREGRTRLLEDPPASEIVKAIQDYLGNHGNLNMCDGFLRGRFSDYYART